jgi:hypothetical protein
MPRDSRGSIARMSDPTKSPDEAHKEFFERRSAVTVAVLAALLAFVSMYSSGSGSDAQMAATKASDEWSYYQSKSVKEHTFQVDRDLAAVLAPSAVDEAKRAAFIDNCNKQAAKYEKEKDEAKAKAQDFEKQIDDANRSGSRFGLGALLLQIAIVITSVSLLVRRFGIWLLGMLLGLTGAWIGIAPLLPVPKWMGGM